MSEVSKDYSFIRQIKEEEQSCFLGCDALDVFFETKILFLDEKNGVLELVNSIPYDLVKKFLLANNFSIRVGMLRISSVSIRPDGDTLLFQMDRQAYVRDTRSRDRQTRKIIGDRCRVLNPYDKVTTFSLRVVECTEGGMSFLVEEDSSLFRVGLLIERITLHSPDGNEENKRGEVTYKLKLIDLSGRSVYQVGLKFIG